MIITVVDRLHVAPERLKGLYVAFVGQEGEPHLAERVERLEAGENKSVVFESVAHNLRDLMGHAGVDAAFNLAECFGNKAARLRCVEHGGVEAPGIIDHAGGVKKGVVVKIGAWSPGRQFQQVRFIQRAQSGVKRDI